MYSKLPNVQCTVVDVSVDAPPVIGAGHPCHLVGVYVNTVLSAHTVDIKDGSTTKLTLPASLAAGTNLQFPNGVLFPNGITITPNASSTGSIAVMWAPD